MEETIKKISKETLNELNKADKLPYPFYYKEVFNSIAKEMKLLEQLNPKLLCINPSINETILEATRKTLNHVQNTSKSIKISSENIVEEINEANPEEIREIVIKFSAFLINNIDKMENKIKALESELDKAYKDLLIDPLTKAYNRKALNKDFLQILPKKQNKDLDLALAIIDLDNFKYINDTYGHLVGDFVLIKFVQIMKKLTRTSDKIYRYGGDEFIIVFNRTHLNFAIKTIERIIDKIRKIKLQYKENLISFRVSAGITSHKKGDNIDTFIQRADEALYEAKQAKDGYKVNS